MYLRKWKIYIVKYMRETFANIGNSFFFHFNSDNQIFLLNNIEI